MKNFILPILVGFFSMTLFFSCSSDECVNCTNCKNSYYEGEMCEEDVPDGKTLGHWKGVAEAATPSGGGECDCTYN